MRDPTGRLLLDELLEAATAEGLDLTPEKLHRWRKAGLMPSPELRALGRGLGTSASYPSTALAQALTIGALLQRSRDLKIVRWALFIDGFPISMRLLRAQLREEADRLLAEKIELLVAAGYSDESDEAAQRFSDRLGRKARRRARSPLFRYVRESLGRTSFMTFLDLVERLGSGTQAELEPADQNLVTRIMPGLEGAGLDLPRAHSIFTEFMNPTPISLALERASEETLLLTRLELVQVAEVLRRAATIVPGLGAALALEIRLDPEWPPPIFFLFWLRHRENPQIRLAVVALGTHLNSLSASTANDEKSDA